MKDKNEFVFSEEKFRPTQDFLELQFCMGYAHLVTKQTPWPNITTIRARHTATRLSLDFGLRRRRSVSKVGHDDARVARPRGYAGCEGGAKAADEENGCGPAWGVLVGGYAGRGARQRRPLQRDAAAAGHEAQVGGLGGALVSGLRRVFPPLPLPPFCWQAMFWVSLPVVGREKRGLGGERGRGRGEKEKKVPTRARSKQTGRGGEA